MANLYRHVYLNDLGYVVYRHCFDGPVEQGARTHKTAVFVTENEASEYCRHRNDLVDKNGDDRLEQG